MDDPGIYLITVGWTMGYVFYAFFSMFPQFITSDYEPDINDNDLRGSYCILYKFPNGMLLT